MVNNSAFYAIPSDDLQETGKQVEEVLGVAFKGVDSDSWGVYYTTPGQGENKISVFQNFNPSDRRWVEPEYAEFPLLLSIYDAPDMDKFHDLLMKDKKLGAVFIEMRDFEKERQDKT